MLTKSLHTITAATNVATYLIEDTRTIYRDASALAYAALKVLGQGSGFGDWLTGRCDDPTRARIVANCAKLLTAQQGPRRGIYEDMVQS